MKHLLLIVLISGGSIPAALAQSATSSQDTGIVYNAAGKNNPSTKYITMQNGKMMIAKDGKVQPMLSDVILPNGVTVMINGAIKGIDGSTLQLKEGDSVGVDGKIIMNVTNLSGDSTLRTVDSSLQKSL